MHSFTLSTPRCITDSRMTRNPRLQAPVHTPATRAPRVPVSLRRRQPPPSLQPRLQPSQPLSSRRQSPRRRPFTIRSPRTQCQSTACRICIRASTRRSIRITIIHPCNTHRKRAPCHTPASCPSPRPRSAPWSQPRSRQQAQHPERRPQSGLTRRHKQHPAPRRSKRSRSRSPQSRTRSGSLSAIIPPWSPLIICPRRRPSPITIIPAPLIIRRRSATRCWAPPASPQ